MATRGRGTKADEATSETRNERRKRETREKLLKAARALAAEKEPSAISIAEIAERADVGFGSFYNHFESKEAILEEATLMAARELRASIEAVVTQEPDPAVRMVQAMRYVMRHALRDKMWGWFLVGTDHALTGIRESMGSAMASDLRLGRDTGRFTFEDASVVVEFLMGGSLALIRAALEGRLSTDKAEQGLTLMLRSLGVEGPLEPLTKHPLKPLRR